MSTLPFPSTTATVASSSPKFMVLACVTGALNGIIGIVLLPVEIRPWNWWFALQMFVICGLCFSIFRSSWFVTRRCGDMFGLAAATTFGNAIASLFLLSSTYYAEMYKSNTPIMPICHIIFGILLVKLMQMHKRDICPLAEGDSVIFEATNDSTIKRRQRLFKRLMGPLASIVFGFGTSRLGSGMVPAGHFVEGLIGMTTGVLMLGLYFRRFRTSAWGSVVSCIWAGIVLIEFIAACLLYADRRSSRTEKFQYGFSWLACLIYLSSWAVAFLFQALWLGERLNCNFSKNPLDSAKSTTVVVAPSPSTVSQRVVPGFEAQPYGMTREEAEATARKLGFGSPLEGPDRDPTSMTDVSEQPKR